MVKSLVSKLSSASNLSLASTLSSVGGGIGIGGGASGHGSSAADTNYAKHRNDPGRFFGDGVQFKAKLIGILEVGEARGDRMCQEALQDLKMAIRAAGEHKQRITIHVTIDGLRLRDEKTGDSLYHHPVHKISFIAQDMTDSRAFGYIFGSPDSGHRFFGIKTDKAASQVVLAMRDLFQVVFELKKKEIELARQQIQSKSIHEHPLASLSSLKSGGASVAGHNDLNGGGNGAGVTVTLSMLGSMGGSSNAHAGAAGMSRLGVNLDSKGAGKELSPESVADLVDLEQELSSIQRGITQMERITPSEPSSAQTFVSASGGGGPRSAGGGGSSGIGVGGTDEDPFGDSFTKFPSYNLLPPPESGRSTRQKTAKSLESNNTGGSGSMSALLSPAPLASNSPATMLQGAGDDDDDSWLNDLDQQPDVFDTSKSAAGGVLVAGLASGSGGVVGLPMAPLAPSESTSTPTQQLSGENSILADMEALAGAGGIDAMSGMAATAATNAAQTSSDQANVISDAFTDLDPLGTGRTRPYVDKKYFFQELKNPPKKVLKDLSSNNGNTVEFSSVASYTAASAVVDEFLSKEGLFDDAIMMGGAIPMESSSDLEHFHQQQPHHQLILNVTNTNYGNNSSSINNTSGTSITYAATKVTSMTTSIPTTNATKSTSLIGVLTPITQSATNNTTTNTTTTSNFCTCTTALTTATTRFTNPPSLLTTSSTTCSSSVPSVAIKLQYPSSTSSTQTHTQATPTNIHLNHYTLDPVPVAAIVSSTSSATTGEVVMLPRDTDPFSPTRKKSDPFQDGGVDIFSKLDPFEFEFPTTVAAAAAASAKSDSGSATTAATVVSDQDTVTAALPPRRSEDVFNGPLQVNLPPESSSGISSPAAPQWKGDISRLERQSSESAPSSSMAMGNNIGSTVRLRPTPSASGQFSSSFGGVGNNHVSTSAFKQQTADVISSISNKKMPHLFGQARFSKRAGGDSNSINMRRLQESDSLSENEAAPEPPPRPDSVSHSEPPPLPPKKQFNDIIIRPRVTSGNAMPPSVAPALPAHSISSQQSSVCVMTTRQEFFKPSTKQTNATANRSAGCSVDVPPIPLPSRRVGRSDGTYPGPGRPRKPGHTEDDYLAPISVVTACGTNSINATDVPPLLPPPTQTSSRVRAQRQQSLQSSKVATAQDIYENKTEIMQQQQQKVVPTDDGTSNVAAAATAAILPDITLSQLLTLGIDELATKLNVPTSKLSTMTLVELTTYLSEFIEKSKPNPQAISAGIISTSQSISPLPPTEPPPIFKVNFDQQATFVAKFDDTFGEDMPSSARKTRTGHGEPFVANFAQFNEPPAPPVPPPAARSQVSTTSTPAVPSADRYAVFREIIDQELQQQYEETDLMGDLTPPEIEIDDAKAEETRQNTAVAPQMPPLTSSSRFEANFDDDDFLTGAPPPSQQPPPPPPPKIDTNITEVVAQAKDRYAALRDIILVENLFDKQPAAGTAEKDLMQEFPEFGDGDDDDFNEDADDLKQFMGGDRAGPIGSRADRIGLVDSRGFPTEPSSSALTVEDDEDDDEEDEEDGGGESSLDSNEKDARGSSSLPQDQYEQLSTSTQQLNVEKVEKQEQQSINAHAKQDSKFLTVVGSMSALSGSKDDLEIDALMQRAISNLSLDSRERTSPANSTVAGGNGSAATLSSALPRPCTVPSATLTPQSQKFNDMSTSPIPSLHKSPVPSQKSPLTTNSNAKSPQVSPILAELSAVSNLIDTATKQIGSTDLLSSDAAISPSALLKSPKESWATFDSPKPDGSVGVGGGGDKRKPVKFRSLHLPPPPPSNTSQNDTADSPCSSDPRDEGVVSGGWSKSVGGRRWPKSKERQQTSSSSRDLSPWENEAPPVDYQKQKRMPLSQGPHLHATDRHGYYMRHARRMNSCDEDYDYEEEFSSRRDHRKFKQGISRSRDNFDLDSPSWYHHAPHHTWSPQDVEQAAAARARSFERSAYERTTYGPPIYDKRGVPLPPSSAATSSYDRRRYEDKRSASGGKYYRDYSRPNYDFDEYGESPTQEPPRYRDAGSFEKLKLGSGRRSDYENVYDDGRGYKSRAEYLYERDRKSFDRESVESFESASRRRRSFGSGDVYGSLESREEFRDRYMGGSGGVEKTRSLRKGMKLRATGDIDYEQDSGDDYHQQQQQLKQQSRARPMPGEHTRSLQRPSQLSAATSGGVGGGGGSGVGQMRMRKSSGSSPWDAEELPLPGQKSWKRPSSAADSERRLAESRRAAALGQTPSGSDGEKDRRFRKKQRSRGKDLPPNSTGGGLPAGIAPPPTTSGGRYGNSAASTAPRDNYDYYDVDNEDDDGDDGDRDDDEGGDDYVDEEFDETPTDEDKFERLNRRRHEMHQRMLESERRQHGSKLRVAPGSGTAVPPSIVKKLHSSGRGAGEYNFDDYAQTPTPPRSTTSVGGGAVGTGSKFSFDGGFESDFNQSSPPHGPAGTASSCNSTPAASASAITTPATKSSFRFSNDFSERGGGGERGGSGGGGLQAYTQNSTSVSSLQQFGDLDAPPAGIMATTASTSPAAVAAAATVSTSSATPPASTTITTQKLRFDDNVRVSQFDEGGSAAFEDDFSKAQFDFEKADQWHADSLQTATAAKKHNLRNSKLQQRQEYIRKSESINIFAKKAEDPFEDDEFFKAAPADVLTGGKNGKNGKNGNNGNTNNNGGGNNGHSNFQWDDDSNFAKFDENM